MAQSNNMSLSAYKECFMCWSTLVVKPTAIEKALSLVTQQHWLAIEFWTDSTLLVCCM